MRRKLVSALAIAAVGVMVFGGTALAGHWDGGSSSPYLRQWCQTNPSYPRCP